jgi:hypothetical protein
MSAACHEVLAVWARGYRELLTPLTSWQSLLPSSASARPGLLFMQRSLGANICFCRPTGRTLGGRVLWNALLCGIRFVVPTVRPIAGRGAGVTGRDLDQDDPDAVGVLDLHLGQAPGLHCWLPHDWDSGRGQPGVLSVNIPDLDPDHHRAAGQPGRVPGNLAQPLLSATRSERQHSPAPLPRVGRVTASVSAG